MKVRFATMLMDTLQAALENVEIAFDGVAVDGGVVVLTPRPSSSIQAATCNGCTDASDVTPRAAHQPKNSPVARA